jgi:hypothetical protein
VEDAESRCHSATGTARVSGVDARGAADLALDHHLRVYVAASVYGFNPALRAALAAAAAKTSRAAEAARFGARVGRARLRVARLRRTVCWLLLDTAIGTVAVEALAARFSMLAYFPGPRALVPTLPLVLFILFIAAVFPALAM